MTNILVIDLGTTYFKFALFDRAGRLGHLERIAPPIEDGPDGRMELDAACLADVIAEGIAGLAKRAGGLAGVEAVSFATQTNSFLLLDRRGRPLTPLVLWPDRRAAELEPEVVQRAAIPGFAAATGVPGVNHQFMVAKLLWIARHAADVWRQTTRLCLISDYLTWLLTGQHVTEAGAAGLTGLVEIQRCRWWPEMLASFAIPATWLPAIVRSGTDLGPIAGAAARRFGLSERCRFVVGCLDQYAGAIGAANVRPGLVSETTGTVLATVRCADRLAAGLGATVFQGPAFTEGLYYRMAFGDVSARYLQWYRDLLPDRPAFAELDRLAADVDPGAGGLRLRPDSPLTAPEQVFVGLTSRHSRGHVVRCIMEAVGFALADQVASLGEGPPAREIRSAGGAARSDLWLQIKADILGIPAAATQCEEPTSLGAAILAEASLAKARVVDVADRWVRWRGPHVPDLQRHRQYRRRRG